MNAQRGISSGILLSLGVLATVCFLGNNRTAQASLPPTKPAGRVLSARESKAADVAAIQFEVLRQRARYQNATHIGIEQEGKKVVDPSAAMMHALSTARIALQPVSNLARNGAKGDFILVTVSDLKWQSKNKVLVSGTYYFSQWRISSLYYVATREKVSKTNPTGWVLTPEEQGCGHWSKLTIQCDGTPTIIKYSR